MSSNAAAKRSRATNEQLNHMVDFMLNNPGLAGRRFQELHGKLECKKKWNELSDALNSLGGAVKTIDQWRNVWKDLKSRTSVRVRERKKQQASTGNKSTSQEPITELEKRVVALIGSDYVEAHNSVCENVPLNEEYQLLLEDGEEFILEVPPSPSTTGNGFECNTPTIPNGTSRRTLKRKRAEKGSKSQKQFLEIANKQADALKMLAESSAANVEVTKKQAQALKMLGECTAANLEVSKMMAEAISTMGEGLKATADAFNNIASAMHEFSGKKSKHECNNQ